MNSQNKKIALITGAGGGIGEAVARELYNHGCKVVIHYRSNEDCAKKLAAELKDSELIKADLTQEADIDLIVEKLKSLGGIDILVNNAGMTIDAPFLMTKIEDYDLVLNLNLKSNFLITKKLAKQMIRKKSGRIINISSVIGVTGNAGQSVYGMTKAAIINLTKTLSMELAAYNILVNSVAPGFIETAMTEKIPSEVKLKILEKISLNKIGSPVDVAKMVRFLALEADYCTGATFHVNGGMYGI